MGFLMAHHRGQSSAGPSWEFIKTQLILDTRRVCWCHTICKQQKARREAAAAEVPAWGSQQHSGNFLEPGVRLLCIVQTAAPAPSPPSQPSHLFQVSTCPWVPCQPMQIPHHSVTFSSLRQGFTDSLSLHGRTANICFPQTFNSAVPEVCSSLPSRACLIRVKVCGDRFYPAALVLSMGMPRWQPQAVLFIIFITQADAVTHTQKRLATIPLRFVGRGAQHSHACATSSWTENSSTPGPRRAGASSRAREAAAVLEQPQTWAGTGKGERAGKKGPPSHPDGHRISHFLQGWAPRALRVQRPDLYPTILIGALPGCHIISERVIVQYIILLLNQDNASIKNIIITCSTMNKFCRAPEHHISITDSSISSFFFF